MDARHPIYIENVAPGSAWGAVVAMALCAGILISSEFLPVSLLTPIASDLQITEGHAGQSISISGLFAMLTSLFISTLIGNADRKRTMLFFTALMIVSGCVVTFAPNATLLMIGRAFLGIAVGGFWSISAAIIMRLVPKASAPKALALLNGGNALASTFAAPLGSFLGSQVGWRGAFFCLVPLAAVAFVWLWKGLPSLPAEHQRRPITAVLKLLARRQVAFGMAACALLFMGQFTLFTYLRPFLETVTHANSNTLTIMLLGIGMAGFAGTYVIGILLKKYLYRLLIGAPFIMGLLAVALIIYGSSTWVTGALLLAWGLFATSIPVGWWSWLSRTLPHDAEAGGGLIVGIIQLAIMFGAAFGGVIYDFYGYQQTFGFAAFLLFTGALMSFLTWHASVRHQPLPQAA